MSELINTSLFNDANLAAYYRLNGNSNDSKNSYNGTDTDITYGTDYGYYSQGALFNGSTSKIVLPNLGISGSTARSVVAWVKPIYGNNLVIYHSGVRSPASEFTCIIDGLGRPYLTCYGIDYCSNGTVTYNTWAHVAFVYIGGQVTTSNNAFKLYINGILQSVTVTGSTYTPNTSNSNYAIGYDATGTWTRLNGSIDDVGIFNKALTAEEIASLSDINVTLYNDSYLRAYYHLEGNSNDIKGNNNGTDTSITYGIDYGYSDQGVLFNGSTSRIALPNLYISGAMARSVTAWIKVASGNGGIVYFSGINGTAQNFVCCIQTDAKIELSCWGIDYHSVGTIGNNTWTHVSFVYVGGQVTTTNNAFKLYINGALQSVTVTGSTITPNTSNSNYFIGDDYNGTWANLNGSIDEIMVYNRALTSDEIATLAGSSATPSTFVPRIIWF